MTDNVNEIENELVANMDDSGDGDFVFMAEDSVSGKKFERTLTKELVTKLFFQKEVYLRTLALKVQDDLEGFETYKEKINKEVLDKIMADRRKTKHQKLNWLKGMVRYKGLESLPKQLETTIDYLGMLSKWRSDFLDMIKESRPERHSYLFDNYKEQYEEYFKKFANSGALHFGPMEDKDSEDSEEVNP